MTEKTKLAVVVYRHDNDRNSNISSVALSAYHVTTWTDTENGKVINRRKTDRMKSIRIAMEHMDSMTDYAVAVMEQVAPQMVYTALNTVYARYASEKIRLLMNECIVYAKSMTGRTFEFACDVAENVTYPDWLSKSDYIAETECTEKHGLQRQKQHTYKMVMGTDGKRHKTPIIPYTELKTSRFGMGMNDQNIAMGTDVEDLIQTALRAMCELYNIGLLHCPSDLWNYAGYIYKAVNHVIMTERRNSAVADSLLIVDSDGNETTRTTAYIDKRLEKIDRNSVMDSICNVLIAKCGKRTNKEMLVSVFRLYYIDNHSQQAVADRLHIAQQQVDRYIRYIVGILSTPEMAETLKNSVANVI